MTDCHASHYVEIFKPNYPGYSNNDNIMVSVPIDEIFLHSALKYTTKFAQSSIDSFICMYYNFNLLQSIKMQQHFLMNPKKMFAEICSPWKKNPRKNSSHGRKILGKIVPGKLVAGKMFLGKLVPGKMVPGKLVPGKMVTENLKTKKTWGERRALWCACEMFGRDQSMETQNFLVTENLF